MESKIKSLKRTKLIPAVIARISAVSDGSDAPVKDLLDYAPNKLAARLHPVVQYLKVAEVIEHSKDMKSYVLEIDRDKGTTEAAWFSAGKYLSVRLKIGKATFNRPYSIASSPRDTLEGKYRITVKRVEGGLASNYILDSWTVGTNVTTSAPLGDFTYERLRDAKTVVGIAGGSGITPFRSFAKAIYEGDEDFDLVLLYGSRTKADAVFSDEIEAWGKACGKIKVVNVLSAEACEGCESGFITKEIIEKYAPAGEKYSVFMCGPQVMYDFADREIEKIGLERKYVRHELFGEYFHPEKNADYTGDVNATYTVKATVCGKEYTVSCKADESVLRALEAAGVNAPSDCRSGRCGWCRSQLLSGDVYVPASVDGRRIADVEYGYIHPCCTFPLSDLVIDVPPQNG